MTAVQDFLESEWKENEHEIAKIEREKAKQKSIRDLREALGSTLSCVADAKTHLAQTPRSAPRLDGLTRGGIFVVGWVLLEILVGLFISLPLAMIMGKDPPLWFGLLLLFIVAVLAWFTPEIVFGIRERLRLGPVHRQAREDYTRLSHRAEQLRQEIKAAEAAK